MDEAELRTLRGSRRRHGLPGPDGSLNPGDDDRPATHGGAAAARRDAAEAEARDRAVAMFGEVQAAPIAER